MHLISRKSYGIRIQLGDFYKIIIIENNSPYREEIIYYKIPNSLKNVLSCETVDAFDLLNITYLNNNKWKIDWKPYEKFQPKKLVYSINGIDLKNIENNLNRSFSIVEIDELKSNEEYIIINSTFYYGLINFENCKWESSINFKVPFIPETNYIFEICIGVVAIFSIIIALICHYYKRIIETVKLFLPNSPDNSIQRINETSITGIIKINPNYNPLEFTDNQYDQYEIPRNKIELKHEIGRGTFGKVFYAKWYNSNTTRDYLMVAVKQLKDEATLDELCDFKTEIDILKSVGEHPNIVRLLGCCALQIPYLMVMEFVACGALKNYLMQLRIKWERKKNQQHFFPSDMDVHFWAQTSSNPRMVTSAASDSSSSSYISPNKSPLFVPSTTAGYWANKEPNSPRHFFINSQKFNYSPTQAASSSSAEYSPFLADFIETLPKIASNQQPSTSEEEKTPAIEDFTSVLTPELNHIELHDFATQIANGMAHLESMSIIHRDLAARNILITPDKKLKISDFGMSKRGSYIIRSNKPLPLRWMAIEAIQNKQCDSKSDVWSFGVVLWEIGTLGAHPYEDIPNELILDSLINGVRLNRPEICTNELYTLMQHCWNEVSENRPSFKELHGNLTSVKNKVYVDFKTINPNYNFPPIEEKPQCTKNMTNT